MQLAGRMLSRMAGGTTPSHVAGCYQGLVDALVIDEADAPADAPVELVVTKTLMHDGQSERRLAEVVLEAVCGVALVGGTGPFGRALATRLAAGGESTS